MASGHVNRANRPNTWAHRPILQNVKKVLANSEPSTHGGRAENICYQRVFPGWTPSGHQVAVAMKQQ